VQLKRGSHVRLARPKKMTTAYLIVPSSHFVTLLLGSLPAVRIWAAFYLFGQTLFACLL
jgi:hypothetical protein